MNVAYVSLDEVHEDQVRRLTRACGTRIEVFWPLESIPSHEFPIVIYDLDYISADHHARLFKRLSSRRAARVIAVHSYNLTRRQRNSLRRNGILVSRRLGPALLSRAIERAAGETAVLGDAA